MLTLAASGGALATVAAEAAPAEGDPRGRDTRCPAAFAAVMICLPRPDNVLAGAPCDWSFLYVFSKRFSAADC
jgi:hypothetical protein